MPKVIFVDLDHTVFDSAWRDVYIKDEMTPKDWDHYHSKSIDDEHIIEMVELVKNLRKVYHAVYITSRPAFFREQTLNSLINLEIAEINTEILMRYSSLSRLDPKDLKLNLVKNFLKFKVNFGFGFLIDDDPQICDHFHRNGFHSLQFRKGESCVY